MRTVFAGNNGSLESNNVPATSAYLSTMQGICLDMYGNLYISDVNNMFVKKVTKSTNIITIVAGNGTTDISNANGYYTGDGGMIIHR